MSLSTLHILSVGELIFTHCPALLSGCLVTQLLPLHADGIATVGIGTPANIGGTVYKLFDGEFSVPRHLPFRHKLRYDVLGKQTM